MNKVLVLFLLSFIVCSINSNAQSNGFRYSREISPARTSCNRLTLPNDIYGKIASDFSDLRIYKLEENGDSTEIPYVLHLDEPEITTVESEFKLNNESSTNDGHFYTFRLEEPIPVNEIRLAFKDENFDWKIVLEGSFDQDEWFKILKDYQIFSIKNQYSDYKFTDLRFKESSYRFYRLHIFTNTKPQLTSAKILHEKIVAGEIRRYEVNDLSIAKKPTDKNTSDKSSVKFRLPELVPVSMIKVFVHDTIEYYRPIAIRTITDTVKNAATPIYNYSTLFSGTISSLEPQDFFFPTTPVNNIEILISDFDNESLTIDSVQVAGYVYQLIGRFKGEGKYILAYGNGSMRIPKYDIEKFSTHLSKELDSVTCGTETKYADQSSEKTESYFSKI